MTNDSVRVRFAPSPTGYVHLGSLRTALFNYLFARHTGGKFILRIEDTDQTRKVEGALENLLEVFDWLGLEFDEGPHIGGAFAPYIQSERTEIYRKHTEQLLQADKAYRCFCSAERLEKVRHSQVSAGKPPMYDRYCRNLSVSNSAKRAENEPFVVRLKMPLEGEIKVLDGVRGNIAFEACGVDDQVLLKSDGFPTYHLANVLDDHLMGITDVIRGEEWLPSTPKHIYLYQAFDWEAPRFYHLPLILNPDRSKLSKRQGDVAVEDYRAKGYLPEALINYCALLGWHPADEKEFFTKAELIREFSLERVVKAGAVFDITKLNWLNRSHINAIPEKEFLEKYRQYLLADFDFKSNIGMKVLKAIREGLDRLIDIPEKLLPFNGQRKLPVEGEAHSWLTTPASKTLFKTTLQELDKIDTLNGETFKESMKSVGKISGIKGKDLWMPIRVALTGDIHGPELALIVEALGKERCVILIKEALMQNSE